MFYVKGKLCCNFWKLSEKSAKRQEYLISNSSFLRKRTKDVIFAPQAIGFLYKTQREDTYS